MSIISTQNIDRLSILILFFLHIIDRFASLSTLKLLLRKSSFDLHGHFLILFGKFSYLILDLSMYFELSKAVVAYPAINLFEEMNVLVFGNWLSGS